MSGWGRSRIVVVALAHLDEQGHLLMVRKIGQDDAILPGGKPVRGETDEEALTREIAEELSCAVIAGSAYHLKTFHDQVTDDGPDLEVRLYAARFAGKPVASSEIRELLWTDPARPRGGPFSRSMDRQIFAYVAALDSRRHARD